MQRLSNLSKNYRSTRNILEAANAVIANNAHRKEKHLWSEMEKKKVSFIHYETAYGYAEDVIDKIQTSVQWETSYQTVQFFTVQMHSHAHLKKMY